MKLAKKLEATIEARKKALMRKQYEKQSFSSSL